MKVKELIALLQNLDQEKDIEYDDGEGLSYGIEKIEVCNYLEETFYIIK